jgi:hypothetical protein
MDHGIDHGDYGIARTRQITAKASLNRPGFGRVFVFVAESSDRRMVVAYRPAGVWGVSPNTAPQA